MDTQQTNSSAHVDKLKSEMTRYAAQLDYVRALKIFSELTALGVQDAEIFCRAARYCFDLRNYRLSLTLVEQALTVSPYHADAMILKGRIFLSQNIVMDALETFESLIIHSRLTEAQRRELREIFAVFVKYSTESVVQTFPNVFKLAKSQQKPLKIGFYMKWEKYSLTSRNTNVAGDELYAEAMCRTLKKFPTVAAAELYAPNHLPTEKLDVMIYLNDTPPISNWADKHVLYLQNSYEDSKKKYASCILSGMTRTFLLPKSRWSFTDKTIDSRRYFCRSAWIRAYFIPDRMTSVLRAKSLTSGAM